MPRSLMLAVWRRRQPRPRSDFSRGHPMNGNALEVAIIADDLTGALDMAAPFAARGLFTQLLLDPRQDAATSDTQVLTLTSASRDLPRKTAERSIRAAMQAALVRRPRLLISKIDSALRGDVAGAILTGLNGSGKRHALIAPAIPSQGRSLRGGEVYVNGVPLRENPLGLVPSSLPSAPLPDLLRNVTAGLSVHSLRRGEVSSLSDVPGLHAYVADCESDEDMDRLARFAIDHSDQVLAVGASGLGTAIAGQLHASGAGRAASSAQIAVRTRAPLLFVIGSCTHASAEQMVRLLGEGAHEIAVPFPVGPDERAEDIVAGGVEAPLILLRPSVSLKFDEGSSEKIAEALGNHAAGLVRRLDIEAVVMSGGDTALAVFRALRVAEARLLGELSPGAAVGTFRLDGRDIVFVTKSGSFGDADALVGAFRALQGGGHPFARG